MAAEPKFVPKDCTLAIAIGAPNLVKLLIIGQGPRAEQIAGWAAQVAQNAPPPSARCAVWITEVAGDDTGTLNQLVGEPYPTVAVLKRDNTVSEVLTDDGDNIDPLVIEAMYLTAGA